MTFFNDFYEDKCYTTIMNDVPIRFREIVIELCVVYVIFLSSKFIIKYIEYY